MDQREAAWDRVHEALPARWRLSLPARDPLTARWSISAFRRDAGRLTKAQTVTGTGETEVDALSDLDDQLLGVPRPDGGRLEELRRRARLAYIAGAEDGSARNAGRPLTGDELEGVVRRFPG